MEIVGSEVRIGVDAILLGLLVGRGKESTDPTALPAGVGHEKRRKNTHSSSRPVRTPWVLVHAALIPAEIASLRAGGLHEVKHGLALHYSVVWIFLADDDVFVKVTSTVGLPFPAQFARVLAFAWLAPLGEPRLLFQGLIWFFYHLIGAADHYEFLCFIKTAGNEMGCWGFFVVDHIRASVDGCTGGCFGLVVDAWEEGDICQQCCVARLVSHLRLVHHCCCCLSFVVIVITGIITTIGGVIAVVIAIVIVRIVWWFIGGAPGV